ncbi:MAG: hypothetical protein ABEI52_10865, partial [Halobacteriaceae archaeon]
MDRTDETSVRHKNFQQGGTGNVEHQPFDAETFSMPDNRGVQFDSLSTTTKLIDQLRYQLIRGKQIEGQILTSLQTRNKDVKNDIDVIRFVSTLQAAPLRIPGCTNNSKDPKDSNVGSPLPPFQEWTKLNKNVTGKEVEYVDRRELESIDEKLNRIRDDIIVEKDYDLTQYKAYKNELKGYSQSLGNMLKPTSIGSSSLH